MSYIFVLTLNADFIGFVGHNNCSMYNYIYTFSDAVWWVIPFLFLIDRLSLTKKAFVVAQFITPLTLCVGSTIHCASDIVIPFLNDNLPLPRHAFVVAQFIAPRTLCWRHYSLRLGHCWRGFQPRFLEFHKNSRGWTDIFL